MTLDRMPFFIYIFSLSLLLLLLKNFRKISDKCDKVHSKLIAIYINKLFPEILPSDIPYINPTPVTTPLNSPTPELVLQVPELCLSISE
jgi:hypothetical protein